MGQKVHPYGFRLGYIRSWHSNWYAKDGYARMLQEDIAIRKYIEKQMKSASVSRTEISRASDQVKVTVYTAKPGVAIGKKGSGIDKIRADLNKMIKGKLIFNISEVKRPDADAKIIAENIAAQLEKRVAFRKAMKKVMQAAFRAGVKGIKVRTAGRLAGAEMARTEGYAERKVPLHTLRADIDYNTAEASTSYGIIGVKVWVYKGEIYK
ncbi:MAG: 30S ribosomal protein S3 [Bdellovibrionales bacterium RIFOXYD12_FULL_39_22]|nr:MAG: 30S ribosomal protein S3 [Bdellovibrionales bacterium RIFOXYB1_FULL_39_21]OFZ43377.1 MAG: 30S ribosomal protein S3 [Bdellovibrionales bacterium RIFOXYC12_FULL_39_17]OFZ47398.1 MAG: 30S ribosomal protein S3 [Bdellovibrionales bacterium RIFOXYC1_FULL_39_130]OFZ76278.1 MAG: 30S ribosomal protein S3 [Bdellovibrionales bacterium RIFOXYD1_FULL_39_84]OFZ94316.1 MAG: 30S ribosomal protein S3 [Bdellovibrionales bacterium RIFOXYD12_FULL_39_22]HLE12077.1 30S ribosomal protein S3 [Bacteriovoracace